MAGFLDKLNHVQSLSTGHLSLLIVGSVSSILSLLLLANAPLLSPFAWIGIPHSLLQLSLWWYIGNFFAIVGMFFVGALVRLWNEKQNIQTKMISEGYILHKGNRSAKKKKVKKESTEKDNRRGTPKPISLPLFDSKNQNDFSVGSPADFNRYQSKLDRRRLTSLHSDRNYDLNHFDNYFDSQLPTKQTQQAPRMQWTGSRVQEYCPSVYEEKVSQSSQSGNFNSMEAEVVLQNMNIGEELYEWRVKMQEWIDKVLARMGKLLSKAQMHRITNPEEEKTVHFIVNSIQRSFPSYSEYVVHRLKVLGNHGCRSRKWTWNSGGDWNGKDWTADLPTDAELTMLVFCMEMDTKLSPNFDSRAFTTKYFVQGRFDPKPSNPVEIAIYQRKRSGNPHFEIIHSDNVKKIDEGKNNLFNALIIFLRLVLKEWSGRLGQIYLGNRNIDLLHVVS